MTDILLSFGSNLGDRANNLKLAVELLCSELELHDAKSSRMYETEPLYVTDQPSFINLALRAQVRCSALALLSVCKGIETSVGRQKRDRYREREIDIDIILFGSEILNTEVLETPHPQMQHRLFVLVPSAEVAADMVHPILKKSIRELLAECTDKSSVVLHSAH